MARVFPPTLDYRSPTRGAARVFGALKQAFADDEDAWIWYRPVLRGVKGAVEPDFVIAAKSLGILVLSVAEWRPEDVLGGGAQRLRVRGEGGEERRVVHPLVEAEDHASVLAAALAGARWDSAPPVRGLCLFTGFTRDAMRAARARQLPLEAELTLGAEDLLPVSDGEVSPLARALARAAGRIPARAWPSGAGSRLRTVIEPQLHFLDPREAGSPVSESPAPPVRRGGLPPGLGFFLDRKQERIARSLASPRTLVYGPAGSGKTVFLVSRARYWMDRNPNARVLFTCYNASLSSHLRKEFERRGVAVDDERLTVQHYHDVCRRMLGMGADFHEKPPEFYAVLEPKVLQELARTDDPPAYDLILVDEGQDFTRRMFEVLVRLSAPGGEITVVCDPAQDLYGRWSEQNIDPLGTPAVERLADCYRNTAPIFGLALSVLGAGILRQMGLDRVTMTRPEDLGREGPPPELVPLDDLDALVDLIHDATARFEREGRPLSDLAVLYPNRGAIPEFARRLRESGWVDAGAFGGEDVETAESRPGIGTLHPKTKAAPPVPVDTRSHFAEVLERELLSRNVPAEWVARDFASKAAYDITKPRLTLSTVFSAKGMDYHTVILLGAEALPEPGPEPGEKEASLLFTGITRARERLVIPYFEDAGWVSRLRELRDEAAHVSEGDR